MSFCAEKHKESIASYSKALHHTDIQYCIIAADKLHCCDEDGLIQSKGVKCRQTKGKLTNEIQLFFLNGRVAKIIFTDYTIA